MPRSLLVGCVALSMAVGCRTRRDETRAPTATSVVSAESAATAAPEIRTPLGVIFADARARGLYKQCRAAPTQVDGEWTPTPADVAALERELPQYLATHGSSPGFGERLAPLNNYLGQYGGFLRGHQRFIYASFFPRRMLTEFGRGRGQIDLDWQRDPIHVCDGGAAFFGIVYDVDAHRFSELQVNGVA